MKKNNHDGTNGKAIYARKKKSQAQNLSHPCRLTIMLNDRSSKARTSCRFQVDVSGSLVHDEGSDNLPATMKGDEELLFFKCNINTLYFWFTVNSIPKWNLELCFQAFVGTFIDSEKREKGPTSKGRYLYYLVHTIQNFSSLRLYSTRRNTTHISHIKSQPIAEETANSMHLCQAAVSPSHSPHPHPTSHRQTSVSTRQHQSYLAAALLL